jgi:hypothetical protein
MNPGRVALHRRTPGDAACTEAAGKENDNVAAARLRRSSAGSAAVRGGGEISSEPLPFGDRSVSTADQRATLRILHE